MPFDEQAVHRALENPRERVLVIAASIATLVLLYLYFKDKAAASGGSGTVLGSPGTTNNPGQNPIEKAAQLASVDFKLAFNNTQNVSLGHLYQSGGGSSGGGGGGLKILGVQIFGGGGSSSTHQTNEQFAGQYQNANVQSLDIGGSNLTPSEIAALESWITQETGTATQRNTFGNQTVKTDTLSYAGLLYPYTPVP